MQRWRLVLSRAALEPELAQRTQAAWEAALVECGLPLAGLDGPRARPRFAAAAPLAASIPGEAELLDVWLTERLPRWRVREALARVLPDGHTLADVHDVWLGEAPLPGRVTASVYRAALGAAVDTGAVRAAAVALRAAASLPRVRQKGNAMVAYDLRPFIDAIEVSEAAGADAGPILRMTLLHDPERGVGRPEELLAAVGELVGVPLDVRALARERLVLASPPVVEEAPRPRGPRPRPGDEGRGPAPPRRP